MKTWDSVYVSHLCMVEETLDVRRPKLSSLFQLIPIAERIKPIYIINMIKLVKLFVTQFQLEIGMIRPFTNN